MATLLLRDLTPATRYKVQIRAVEGDSVSEWSRLFDLETIMDDVSPDVPDWDGTGWVSSGDTFVATWIPIDPALDQNLDFAFYEVELSDGTTTTVVNTQNNSYTLTFEDNRNLFGTPKPTVLARVRAVDAVGNRSVWTTQKSASNPAPTAPASITPTAVSDGIGLKWDKSPDNDVIGYQVHTGTTAGFTPTPANRIFLGDALEFNYATLSYGTDHWFKVYAVDIFGQTSTTPTATTQSVRPVSPFVVDTTPPDVPTGLASVITNNTSGVGARAAVSWTMASPPSDLAGFYVRYRKVGDANWSSASFQKDDRAGIIELVSAFQNYEFQIKAVDSYANESAWSATVTATAPANTAPGNVTGLTATPTRDAITYKWNQLTDNDIKNYELTFSTSPTFASDNITFLTGEAAFVNVGGLTPGTTYYARVRALDTGGLASGSWSATDTTATLSQLTPGDIGAPTLDQFGNLQVKVDDSIKTYVEEYYLSTSESTQTGGSWSTTPPTRTPGTFIWTRTLLTYQDNSTNTTPAVLLTGNTGSAGTSGRGISSTAVTYQTHTNGTTAPTGTWTTSIPTTTAGEYLWTRTVYTYTDATTDTAYSVSAHGQTGTAGKGISSTAVTYQVGTSGTTAPTGTWTTTIPTTAPGEFLWTRTITTYTDSTTTTAYSVAAHGEAGNDGADGVGISSTAVTYQVGSSGTTAPTGTWTTSVPSTSAGQFLWTRTITTYTDATTTTAYSVAAHGATGNTGATGRGISSTAVDYAKSTDGVNAPASGWTTTIPSTVAGEYLWTRTTITYTSGTPATSVVYSVARHGATGGTGRGITSITPYYARVTAGSPPTQPPNGTVTPAAPWQVTEPDYLAGTELYRTEKILYTDSTIEYTAQVKVSAYTAAATAMTTANGKNKIIFSTSDATGTTGYVAGDTWFKRDASNIIIGQWEFISGAWSPRTVGNEVIANLNVGKLVSGDIATALIKITNSGAIQSSDYAAGSLGWKLDSDGLEVNKGSVKASTLIGDTIGSSTGVINIAAGAGIVLNGGYLKSNTYSGTTYNAAATAGWFLNDTGLVIAQGAVKASTLTTGDIASASITLSSTAEIKTSGYVHGTSTSGFRLSPSGLQIPDGSLEAAKLIITSTFAQNVQNEVTTIDGGKITTGAIQSSQTVTVNGASVPAWSINTGGYASFAGAQILGNTVLGSASTDTTSRIQSYNYVAGAAGWMIRADGYADISQLSVRGLQNNQTFASDFNDMTEWNQIIGGNLSYRTDIQDFGGKVLQSNAQYYTMYGTARIPFDEDMLYKVTLRVRSGGGLPNFYLGVRTYAGDKTTITGSNGNWYGISNLEISQTGVWEEHTAYFLGANGTNGVNSNGNTVDTPGALPDGTKYFAPMFLFNYGAVAGDVMQVSMYKVEAVGQVSDIQDMWGSQQDRTLIDGGNISTNTITLDALKSGNLEKVINLANGSSLLSTGAMGEKVALGQFGFYVKGPQENVVTFKSSSGTTRTLTTALAHNFVVGQKIVVKIGDTSYDNDNTTKSYLVASVPTTTTFTFTHATSLTQASTAVTAGVVQGLNPALGDGQDFITFPTDGTEPNIISGQLTASDVIVSEGMSIRKTSNVEAGAQLIINHVVEAPKIAPALSQTYSDIQMKGYEGTLISVARGHNGNYFVLAGTTNDYRISEHSTTGAFIANRYTYDVMSTVYREPRGLVYAAPVLGGTPTGRYYLTYSYTSRLIYSYVIDTFNTSWASQGTYMLGQTTTGVDPYPKSRIGWDYTNNRLMIGFRGASGSTNVTVRYFTNNTTTGVPTGAVSGDTTVLYAGSNPIGFIARGPFDYGGATDQIVFKDTTYSDTVTSGMQYCVATNTGAVDSTKNWPVANNSTIAGGAWDATSARFIDLNISGYTRFYSHGDSYWASSTLMQDTRWVRYAWYNKTNDVETNLSSAASFSLSKRAKLNVTTAPVPYLGGSTPDHARIYVLDSPTDTFTTATNPDSAPNYYLRATIPYTSSTATIDPSAPGTTGTQIADVTLNEFGAYGSSPGQIVSSTGNSFWKGDDTAQFYQLVLTSNAEATSSSGNKPALRIGDIYGQHLRIDSNEILAMESDTSRVGGELELSADQIKLNIVDGGLIVVGHANHRGKIRTVSDSGTSLVFKDSSLGVSNATSNPASYTASNTIGLHAADIHSWTGGLFMEDLAGGGSTGATIGNAGRIVRTSSIKMKEAIEPMKFEEAKSVLGLESYTFRFKQDSKESPQDPRRYPGFIAEQAAEAGAELWVGRQHKVDRDDDGKMKITRDKNGEIIYFRTAEITVAHNVLIKELYKENEALSSKNEELEDRMARLEALVEALAG